MIQLFKKTIANIGTIAEKPQSVKEVIEEIHQTFYTEVDRLLEVAKVSHSLETDMQDAIDKSARLKALGFTNTKEVKKAELEESRLWQLSVANEEKAKLIKAINYFSFKYPQYKFITEDSVNRICDKYNLIYGSIENYIGSVPDENLAKMEEFKIKEEDECYQKTLKFSYSPAQVSYISYQFYKQMQDSYDRLSIVDRYMMMYRSSYSENVDKSPLEIAAPRKDFDMENMELKGNKLVAKPIEIPDPVVLKPVYYEGSKYYLIVTAWGLEASDELVVNQKLN